MGNIYFDLIRKFNAEGRAVVLASGQAVVCCRPAIMSKDGMPLPEAHEYACRLAAELLPVAPVEASGAPCAD